MRARIYQPTKAATQSGRAATHNWVLRFERASSTRVEPVMGWTGGDDMDQEVRLSFPTKEAAVAYAEANGIAYAAPEPNGRVVRRRAYADNFASDRIEARSRPLR
ncbi:MAG: ETC complex I subunit [Alphaproteobacteria bacterium]|jgi:hypothetical protein|nr:ETC complex I subunit [Alphaproteobacteria bacterium]